MDKQIYREETFFRPQGRPTGKKIKVMRSLEDAVEAFDKDDDTAEFIVHPATARETDTPELPPVPPVPTDAEVQRHLIRNALLLIDGGEFSLARNVLGDVLSRDNNCAEAIRWMGWCFRQEGDYEAAQKCYEQLVQLRVTDQDLFELGEIYYFLKRDNEAQATWMDALGQCDAESPRLFDLHKNLGNVFFRLGDLDGAEENYNKALVLRPQSDALQVNLGSLHYHKKHFKAAMEHFKRALEINAYNDKGWCGVALVSGEMKDHDWAWGVLLKSLDLNPYNLTALQILVNWSQTEMKWDEAIVRIQTYMDKFQEDADMISSLAGLLFQQGRLDAAELEICRLEALEPSRPEIFEYRGLIQKKREATE